MVVRDSSYRRPMINSPPRENIRSQKNHLNREWRRVGNRSSFKEVLMGGVSTATESEFQRQRSGEEGEGGGFEFQNCEATNGPGPNSGSTTGSKRQVGWQRDLNEITDGPHVTKGLNTQKTNTPATGLQSDSLSLEGNPHRSKKTVTKRSKAARRYHQMECMLSEETQEDRSGPPRRGSHLQQKQRKVVGATNRDKLSVYTRRQKRGVGSNNKEKGIRIVEGRKIEKRYQDREWVEKMKQIQREPGDQSDTSSEEDQEAISEAGSASLMDQPLAIVPMGGATSGEGEPIYYSEAADSGPGSEGIGLYIEERAIQWVLDNILSIGKAIGLSYEGREADTVNLFEEIENRRLLDKGGLKKKKMKSKKGAR